MGALCCCCTSKKAASEPQPRTCCESFAWHLREFRVLYMVLATVVMIGGVGILIAGIVTFVDPANRSTVGTEYDDYLKDHDAEESSVIRATTVTTDTGVTVSSVNELIPFRFVADAKGTETKSMTLSDTYWKTTIPRPSAATTLNIIISTYVLWQGHNISTPSITMPVVSLANGSTLLQEACFVIERTASLQYTKSSTYESCFYPFTADSQRYAAVSASSSITLSFRSGFSPYVSMLQRFGKGDLNNVRDEEVLTSSTPLALIGVGVAAFFVGFITLILFCCCVGRNDTGHSTAGPKQL